MKYKYIEESLNEFNINKLNEWGSAGFSMSSGNGTVGLSKGFGGSSSLGGQNPMYSYTIKDLNRDLQPRPHDVENFETIHLGMDIQGKSMDNKTKHMGKLTLIDKNNSGNVNYYEILDYKTSTKIKLNPSTVSLAPKYDGKSDITIEDRYNFPSGNPLVYGNINHFIKAPNL